MDLDETWQVGLRPEKTKPCTFRAMGFGEREKWVAAQCRRPVVFFCPVYDGPLLPLSLDRFPPNVPRTRVLVVARDTWFHIPEKFPVRGRISRKTVFLGYKTVCLCAGYGSRETFCDAETFHPLADIPQIYPSWLTFAEGCNVFQLYTSKVILSHSIGTNQNNILARAMHTTL